MSPSESRAAEELRRRWAELVIHAGLDDIALPLGDELIARYGEPHRRYHDRRHLLEVLHHADELAGPGGASVVTRLAAWFHDAVYAGRAGDDEAASADLALRSLEAVGLDATRREAVAAIVAATAGHVVPGEGPEVGEDTAVMLDADLAILASEAPRYDRYVVDVRAEHADVDDEQFRTGRLRVLRALAGRERLFHTQRGRRDLDPAARANLAREIERLSSREDDG